MYINTLSVSQTKIAVITVAAILLFNRVGAQPKMYKKDLNPKTENVKVENTVEEEVCPLSFKQKKYDFGKIPKGIPVQFDFMFKNISDKPVIIEGATAQCGCTTPVYPKSGIAPADSNKVSITYNASNPGVFMKQVTVKLMRYKNPVYLIVSGEVMPSDPQKKN